MAMHKFLILQIFIFWPAIFYAQFELEWVKTIGGSNFQRGVGLAIDKNANVHTCGSNYGGMDLDPGPGSTTFNPNITLMGNINLFIQKLDKNGDFVWGKGMGGQLFNSALGVAVDDDLNLYTVGFFEGIVDVDPSLDSLVLSSNGGKDIFIEKSDSAGNLLWAKSIGGASHDERVSIVLDSQGNIYLTGFFLGTIDFDPGAGQYTLTSNGMQDIFILKLNTSGDFIWAKTIGGNLTDVGYDISLDGQGNILIAGSFYSDSIDFDSGPSVYNIYSSSSNSFVSKFTPNGNLIWAKSTGGSGISSCAIDKFGNIHAIGVLYNSTTDFDPGQNTYYLNDLNGGTDVFIQKLDFNGNLLWVKSFGSLNNETGNSIAVDANCNVYTCGEFEQTVDFDPSSNIFNIRAVGSGDDVFIHKLDSNGNFVWAGSIGGNWGDNVYAIEIDNNDNIYLTGSVVIRADFHPGLDVFYVDLNGSSGDVFTMKIRQKGVLGNVFKDLNPNCTRDTSELGLANRIIWFQPGNLMTTTNSIGKWSIDSLPPGNYTATIDTNGGWISNCPITQTFTVTHPDSILVLPSFAMVPTNPCPAPTVSIHAPFLRPGFSNQKVYVKACNDAFGSEILDSAYVIVEIDPLLTVYAATKIYTSLGNNRYQVYLGRLYPGQCIDFNFSCVLSVNAILGQTICMQAEIFPVDICVLDTIANGAANNCPSLWDHSSIELTGACNNDSICFTIYNRGTAGIGDMTCFSPMRLYIDGNYVKYDSIRLNGGDSMKLCFIADGRTWRLEVNQHPLHPGNSHPNATVELCGNINNWTSDLVNILPQDDADPIIDIYCGLVRGSFDPNDKTGFPLGCDNEHFIQQNQDIEYLIRFQNTGTDTAFTVIIRDTLAQELDIRTIQSGVASHPYDFKIYGTRILEWTFRNILLPDSTTNEPKSHGFVKFKTKQQPNLPIGTTINNNAGIYFDFNAPVITNVYTHTVGNLQLQNPHIVNTLQIISCDTQIVNGYVYSAAGTYWQSLPGLFGDTLYKIEIIVPDSNNTVNISYCHNFYLNNQQYSADGTYYLLPNETGCNDTILINLDWSASTDTTLIIASCGPYYFRGSSITNSGLYRFVLPNHVGCDSIINLDLTILNSFETIQVQACDSFTLNGIVYAASGTYTQLLTNSAGCDSILNLDLIIEKSEFINDEVSWDGLNLTVAQSNAVYQWLDCDNGFANVQGATQQRFIPTANGNYAVQVITPNCTSVSQCFNLMNVHTVNLPDFNFLKVYPNPVSDKLNIEIETSQLTQLELYDAYGRLVYQIKDVFSKKELELMQLPAGFYFLRILFGETNKIIKVIKI